MPRRQYLVCYDIANPKRLAAVHKRVKDFGEQIQFSVYLCVLAEIDLARMKESLRTLINSQEDRILIIDLGEGRNPGAMNRMESIGLKPVVRDNRKMIF